MKNSNYVSNQPTESVTVRAVGARSCLRNISQKTIVELFYKLPISDLSGIIHIYPILSENNSETSLLFSQQKYAKNYKLQSFFTGDEKIFCKPQKFVSIQLSAISF